MARLLKSEKQKANNRKRGFSLAETAVALAIIVAISIATTSLLVSSSNLSAQGIVDREAQIRASALVEAFRFAETETELTQAFNAIDADYTRTHTGIRFNYAYQKDTYVILAIAVYGEIDSFSVTAYRGGVLTYDENNHITNHVICSYDGFMKGEQT
ncbi:MAG: hypothetical protein E7363_01495 [Clostridiales bacterium]|nr:hypothetical protein [Clostridiales bacterium]